MNKRFHEFPIFCFLFPKRPPNIVLSSLQLPFTTFTTSLTYQMTRYLIKSEIKENYSSLIPPSTDIRLPSVGLLMGLPQDKQRWRESPPFSNQVESEPGYENIDHNCK